MIDRRVALLRGINVGTAKRMAMADLQKLFTGTARNLTTMMKLLALVRG